MRWLRLKRTIRQMIGSSKMYTGNPVIIDLHLLGETPERVRRRKTYAAHAVLESCPNNSNDGTSIPHQDHKIVRIGTRLRTIPRHPVQSRQRPFP